MTEEKTITRDDIIAAAEAWAAAAAAEADASARLGSTVFARKMSALTEARKAAREEFERLLDAYAGQRSSPARTEVTIVGPVQSGTLRPYPRG